MNNQCQLNICSLCCIQKSNFYYCGTVTECQSTDSAYTVLKIIVAIMTVIIIGISLILVICKFYEVYKLSKKQQQKSNKYRKDSQQQRSDKLKITQTQRNLNIQNNYENKTQSRKDLIIHSHLDINHTDSRKSQEQKIEKNVPNTYSNTQKFIQFKSSSENNLQQHKSNLQAQKKKNGSSNLLTSSILNKSVKK